MDGLPTLQRPGIVTNITSSGLATTTSETWVFDYCPSCVEDTSAALPLQVNSKLAASLLSSLRLLHFPCCQDTQEEGSGNQEEGSACHSHSLFGMKDLNDDCRRYV
jgi:hypothetical protein